MYECHRENRERLKALGKIFPSHLHFTITKLSAMPPVSHCQENQARLVLIAKVLGVN